MMLQLMSRSPLASDARWPAPNVHASTDAYFSADVETDGPVPGPYSMLSFALVQAGSFDGSEYSRPDRFDTTFYRELKPISDCFEPEALAVNGLDRQRLGREGADPRSRDHRSITPVVSTSRQRTQSKLGYRSRGLAGIR